MKMITYIFALLVIQEVAIFQNSFTKKASLGIIGIMWPLQAVSATKKPAQPMPPPRPAMPPPPPPRGGTIISPLLLVPTPAPKDHHRVRPGVFPPPPPPY
ncbi:hypothetical protein A4A49_03633 [Nicotiana attenuata]|uniref:Uncharacterized protein n=1 Tax=Nicotiana attenuata TaxID=49451 RepID=A0A1J6J5S5_NICAT|nr:hypothetical protein A4A49_03633 [Nicotiana attenuata]